MKKAIFFLCLIALLAGTGQISPSPPAEPQTAAHGPAVTALSPRVRASPQAVEELPQATDTAQQTATHHGIEALSTAAGIVPQEDESAAPTQPPTRDKTPNSPPKAPAPKMGDTCI